MQQIYHKKTKTFKSFLKELPSTQKEVGIGGLNVNDKYLACQ